MLPVLQRGSATPTVSSYRVEHCVRRLCASRALPSQSAQAAAALKDCAHGGGTILRRAAAASAKVHL